MKNIHLYQKIFKNKQEQSDCNRVTRITLKTT